MKAVAKCGRVCGCVCVCVRVLEVRGRKKKVSKGKRIGKTGTGEGRRGEKTGKE